MNQNFWHGKRVFVTGHTGFKGSWLSIWLQSLGAQVTGYALSPPTQPSLFESANVAQGMHSIIGDVRDANHIRQAVLDARPEIVIHMAAQPLVRYSYLNPVETYSTNVMGLVYLFEAIRACSDVRAVLNVTSDKCYENKEWAWGYRENEPMGGFDPYSNSKGCAELITAAYRNSYFNLDKYQEHGVAIATARAGNVIGGGDWALDRLIPDILRAISKDEVIEIRNPNAIRPWQHVLEPLSGYLKLAEALYLKGPKYAEGWNFGPFENDVKPVQWIVERMIQMWPKEVAWELTPQPHVHEATYLKLDCSKAHTFLGWQPRWDICKAIDKIIEWQLAYDSKADMREITLSQIDSYQNT